MCLVAIRGHALEARFAARRRHELESLGRRRRPGLVRRERLLHYCCTATLASAASAAALRPNGSKEISQIVFVA